MSVNLGTPNAFVHIITLKAKKSNTLFDETYIHYKLSFFQKLTPMLAPELDELEMRINRNTSISQGPVTPSAGNISTSEKPIPSPQRSLEKSPVVTGAAQLDATDLTSRALKSPASPAAQRTPHPKAKSALNLIVGLTPEVGWILMSHHSNSI